MTTTSDLMRSRRFLPLFVTQLFNAFNDNHEYFAENTPFQN